MRSRRHEKYNDLSCISYEKAGRHGIRVYPLKGKYNSIIFYKNKHLDWWISINREIDELYIDLNNKNWLKSRIRRIRCGKKYKM